MSEISPFVEGFLWIEYSNNLLFMPITFQAEKIWDEKIEIMAEFKHCIDF